MVINRMFLILVVLSLNRLHAFAQSGNSAANTAIIPVAKLEDDSYNWWDRHAEVLRIKDSIDPQIILIGNSITHFWGGLPQLKYSNGRLRQPNGPLSWKKLFGSSRVLNMGFGWDRTQNVLWRIDHGELDSLHPRVVIIDIGTNNTSGTAHAPINTAPEIVAGIIAVHDRVREKCPAAKIVVMAIFPREQQPLHPRRLLIATTNQLLDDYANTHHIIFLDAGKEWLAADGSMRPEMTFDFTHPTEKGYSVWAEALQPYLH